MPHEELGINSFSKSEVEFLFLDDMRLPPWLTPGLPVYVQLILHDTHNDGKLIYSNSYETAWAA